MYSAHQIDCMQQLGTVFLSPRADHTDKPKTSVEAPAVDTNQPSVSNSERSFVTVSDEPVQIPDRLVDDLRVLFPTLIKDNNTLHLTPESRWLFQVNSSRPLATKTQLITGEYSKLSTQDRQKVWSALSAWSNTK